MRIVLEIIAIIIILFDVIMVTPLGAWWMMKDFDEGRPVHGIIAMFVSAVPLMVIFSILGWV